MPRYRASKGDLLLLAGVVGIMGATLVRLNFEIPIWSLGIEPAFWWMAAIAAVLLLWLGICKTMC